MPEHILLDLEEVISFHPAIARALGGVEAALYFQQLYYWRNKGSRDDGFIYKTKDEIKEETCLNRYQQDQARKKPDYNQLPLFQRI